MADYYAGTWEDVKRLIGQSLSVGTGKADILTPAIIEKFMSDVDDEINSVLSQVYFVPLRKVKVGGNYIYPEPIPYIARVLTANSIIATYYKDISPNENIAVRQMYERAYFLLNRLVNSDPGQSNSNVLKGQRLKNRTRFVSPSIAPSKPATPTSGPAGGVG